MTQKKSQLFHWRQDVTQWLTGVAQYQRQSGFNLATAASHCRQSFPTSGLVVFVGQAVSKGIAGWAVKTTLRDAATSLGIPMDDATLDFVSDLAVDAILPAAA
jgi:hypothetical protein